MTTTSTRDDSQWPTPLDEQDGPPFDVDITGMDDGQVRAIAVMMLAECDAREASARAEFRTVFEDFVRRHESEPSDV